MAGSDRHPDSVHPFGDRLFHIQRNRDAFDAVLRQVLAQEFRWRIERLRENEYFLHFSPGQCSHDAEGLGDGVVSVFVIADALYDSAPGNLIAIDEPELSLHPALQRKLGELLVKYSAERQILVATHSPFFVHIPAVIAGGVVAWVYLLGGRAAISQLKRASVGRLKGLVNDLNNPHTFGLDAREVFFLEDQVILTEGQEDVVDFGSITNQLEVALNGKLFGWGVGGAGKMACVAEVLRDLGYERVVGFLDKNKPEELERLRRSFQGYLFLAWPTDSIRTRKAHSRAYVEGLLDENRMMRPKFAERAKELLSQANRYLMP